jgi:hypothetical protein
MDIPALGDGHQPELLLHDDFGEDKGSPLNFIAFAFMLLFEALNIAIVSFISERWENETKHKASKIMVILCESN